MQQSFYPHLLFRRTGNVTSHTSFKINTIVPDIIGLLTNMLNLGKGSKIKLINFAEFSAKGGEVPPIRENNYFFPTKEIAKSKSKSVQNALKHVIK